MSGYNLTAVDYTEEILQSDICPGVSHKGWRRFRINYCNDYGFSNIEGTIYFPPGSGDPYPLLDEICEHFNAKIEYDQTSGNPL